MPTDLQSDHDHEGSIAMLGECLTCLTRDVSGDDTVTVEYHGVQLPARPRATSARAAVAALPRSGTARRRVLDAIAQQPATDEQLQALLAMGPNTERPRRAECVNAGWVHDSGARRPTASGLPSVVWSLTDLGRAELLGNPQPGDQTVDVHGG